MERPDSGGSAAGTSREASFTAVVPPDVLGSGQPSGCLPLMAPTPTNPQEALAYYSKTRPDGIYPAILASNAIVRDAPHIYGCAPFFRQRQYSTPARCVTNTYVTATPYGQATNELGTAIEFWLNMFVPPAVTATRRITTIELPPADAVTSHLHTRAHIAPIPGSDRAGTTLMRSLHGHCFAMITLVIRPPSAARSGSFSTGGDAHSTTTNTDFGAPSAFSILLTGSVTHNRGVVNLAEFEVEVGTTDPALPSVLHFVPSVRFGTSGPRYPVLACYNQLPVGAFSGAPFTTGRPPLTLAVMPVTLPHDGTTTIAGSADTNLNVPRLVARFFAPAAVPAPTRDAARAAQMIGCL